MIGETMRAYIIVGQGAAGTFAARTLRQIDAQASVTMITREPDSFYSRIDLPDIIAGRYTPDDAVLLRQEQFRELDVECRMNEAVRRILPGENTVELTSGVRLRYDKLLVATGSEPVVPPFPGKEARGVYQLWTLDQAREIARATQTARTAVVIGAGLIGLKAALALRQHGLDVTVVEKMPRVMPLQLDETAAGILTEKIRGLGIGVFTDTQVNALQAVDGKVTGVLSDQGPLAAEMVIVAVGVRPNVTLAREAGLAVQRGIVTNEFLETSIPGIYAAGDVAEINDLLTGKPVVPATWPAAVDQGRIAALNMAGERVAYDGATAMNSVEIAGIPLVSVGDISAATGDHVLSARSGDAYRKFVLHDNTLRGVLFMGDIRQAGVAANLVLRHAEVNEIDLLSPTFSFASVMAS
jgi:NAD(P)H-nitrite reductase large subunit